MRSGMWVRLGTALLVICLIGSWCLPAPAEAAKKRILNLASKEPETLDPHTSGLGVLMGTSWPASCPRWSGLRGNSLLMTTLFPSQGDFYATAQVL